MSYWTLVLEDGSELPLDGSAGLALRHISGHGMPPVTTISSEYALRDGALYQRQKTQPRTVQMLIVATDAQECGLRASRERLLTAINPHRLHLPITLCYYDGKGDRRSLCCYYDGGMDGDWEMPYNNEEIVLRLIAFQPYWSGPAAITDTLDVYDAMGVANRIIQRDANGTWDDMNAGADNTVWCLAVATNGDVYAGGEFHNIGGVAADHIAMWDVSASVWVALGTGCTQPVDDLAISADGTLYAVSSGFGNFGAGAHNSIAKWAGGAWSAVAAAVPNSYVHCVTVDWTGNIYAGGQFSNIGGVACNRIAVCNGATWAPLAGGITSGQVNDIAFTQNGDLYVVGSFLNVDGNVWRMIAMWDGTWHQVGGDLDGAPWCVAVAPNGDVYITGIFTICNGVACNHIARWNGTSYSALGLGLNGIGHRISFAPNGDLYCSGAFTTAGGLSTPMKWALWSNGVWLPGWAGTLNGNVYAFSIEDTRTILAGSFTVASVPGVTAIGNIGTARAYPVIVITGPGRLLYLINYTTLQVVYFDITLVASEVLTIDLSPGIKTITSSFRGNLISGVLAGALVTWYLAPGNNYIGCYVNDVTAAGTYTYIPLYWGID